MMASPSLDPKLRNRITRYLHTGNEVPKYYPGCWTSHYFKANKLKAIDEALVNEQNNVEVTDIILKVCLNNNFNNHQVASMFNREKAIRGGSLIILKKSYKFKERKDIVSLSVEQTIEMACAELEHFIVVSVYRPPSGLYEDFEIILEQVLVKLSGSKKLIIAYKDGWYTRFEPIAFALAKCLLIGSPKVKEATYKVASAICKTSEEIMLFNKFTRLLKTGNGRGWCKHIQEWYMKKDPMDLAKEISRVKARHGRSHKTLLRKSHIKIPVNDHARNAVVKYAIIGLKRAKQLLGTAEGTSEIFNYIQKVEDLRHCEDPIAAAAIVAQNQFTIDHVPGHLLISQEVWNAILPQLSLRELLYNIQRIHNMGFLHADSITTNILISLLNKQDLIKKSKITPIEVYITLCNYKTKSRPMKHEKAKVALQKEARRRSRQILDAKTGQWKWNVTKRHPKEVKYWGIDQPVNTSVIASLNKLLDQTWVLTPPTNVRYLITLDMRQHMFKGRHFCTTYLIPNKIKNTKLKSAPGASGDGDNEKKESKKRLLAECFYNKNVTPGHAAIILALQLLKRENSVKLAVFTDEGIEFVTIERNFCNISEAEFVLRKANLGRVQLDAPIQWAAKHNKKFDVFINMVDRTTRYMELDLTARGGRGPGGRYGPPPLPSKEIVDHCPVRALEHYRKNVIHDAKLIVLSLASARVATTDGRHEGVLDIVGIDRHVPKVMDAFVLGQFK